MQLVAYVFKRYLPVGVGVDVLYYRRYHFVGNYVALGLVVVGVVYLNEYAHQHGHHKYISFLVAILVVYPVKLGKMLVQPG